MLYWDKVWKNYEGELERLTSEQCVRLCVLCLQDVLNYYEFYFDRVLDGPQRSLVDASLRALIEGSDDSGLYSAKLDEYVDKPLPIGVWDLFMGIVHLINNLENLSGYGALEVMSFAYQSVLNIEVMSKIETEMREDELRILEAADPACIRTLGRQLEFLNALKS